MPLTTSTAISVGPYYVWDEGTTERLDRAGNNSGATWTIRCVWTERFSVANYVIGGSVDVGGTVVRIPALHYPDNAAWVAMRVNIEGQGDQSVGTHGMIAFEWAVLKIEFGAPPYDQSSGSADVAALELEIGGETIPLSQDASSFKWGPGTGGGIAGVDVPPSVMPGLNCSIVHFSISRYNMPALPVSTVLALVDHSNDASFYGAAAEKIIFRGLNSRRKLSTSGVTNWDIAPLSFEYRPNGANTAYHPTNGWTAVVSKASGTPKPFPTANLLPLVQ